MLLLIHCFSEDSERFLKHFQKMNKYFVETKTYEKVKVIFDRCNIVILTGPPGCGKTMAAVHLIGEKPSNCTFRKIRSCEELSYIEKDENSIILIDNIFSREPKDLENWWKILDKFNEYILQDSIGKSTSPRVRILITARPNVIETACRYMDRVTPILHEDSRINISMLTEDEKHKILEKQIEFATKEKGYQDLNINAEFKREVTTSDGPIGFPLCAHLYACGKEYRKSGAEFFSRPIEYLKLQIKDEIESDKSNRVKTLFFCLFFHEWHMKREDFESFQIQNEYLCKRCLEKVSPNILKHFDPFNFRDLKKEAQKLSGTFFELVGEHTCKFLHDSIYEAVEAYLCETYVTETIKYFPLDIIHQDYKNITEMEMSTLATRLLYEILDQQLYYVFSCRVFRIRKFTDCFCSELKKMSETTIVKIFTIANNNSSVMLPCIFWSSINNLTYLTERFFEIVKEKNINPDYQLYVSLYGICCARNKGLLKTINGMLLNNSEMIKKRVKEFKDQCGNYILHCLVKSQFSDEFVSFAVRKLLSDGMSVNSRNKRKITSLMFAVQQVIPRAKVIEILLEFNPKLPIKDAEDSNVFHYCLGSSIDDKTCARYLEIISRSNNVEKCLEQNDVKGNTALSIAAMFSKPSRIRSILFLLKSNAKTIDILNEDGYSPLHLSVKELKDKKSSVELECCVRVVIFILYGAKLDLESDERKKAVHDCHFDLVKTVLRNPQDKTNMERTLETVLEKTKCNKCKMISEEELMESMKLIPSEIMNTGIQKCIATAVQHLEHHL